MASAMASFNGFLKIGADCETATHVCEVESMRIEFSREMMDATNRCAPGHKRYVAGELDTELTADLVINKDACGAGCSTGAGSMFDEFASWMLTNTSVSDIWFLDAFGDGFYIASGFITSLSQTQNMGEVIKASITIKPESGVDLVWCCAKAGLTEGTVAGPCDSV